MTIKTISVIFVSNCERMSILAIKAAVLV